MKTKIEEVNNIEVAIIESGTILIKDVQSALDFIATASYKTNCNRFVINKSAITEDFFNLSNCMAGQILQKFINYNIKIVIVGDFSNYTSKSLKDFIYESNNGKDIFFVSTQKEAIEKLTKN